MLKNLFKPKWQHTDPRVRSAAITQLNLQDKNTLNILSELALHDSDPEVKTQALNHIQAPDQLLQLLEQAPANSIAAIETRLVELLDQSEQPQELLDGLKRTDLYALYKVVFHSRHQHLKHQLLDEINDPRQLYDTACSALPLELRKRAADKLQDPELIEQLLKHSRQRDKSIHRIMKEKQQQLKAARKAQAAHAEKARQLLEQITALAQGEWFPLYSAKLTALQDSWHQLPQEHTQPLQETFNQQQDTCQQRLAEMQAKEDEAQALRNQQAANEVRLQQLKAFVEKLENQLLADICTQDPTTCRQELQSLLQAFEPSPASDSHITQLQQTAESRLKLLAERPALAADIQQLLSNPNCSVADTKALKQRIHWPESLPRPDWLAPLDEHLKTLKSNQHQRQAATNAQLTALENALQQLQSQIEAGESKAADKGMQRLAQQISQLDSPLPAKLRQRYQSLQARRQEIKDWQGYAVTPKKQQLCDEMEALIHSSLPPQEKADQIHQLQQQWKQLDSTDPFHAQSLWQRFKAASDTAYAPCADYFAQQQAVRKHNLTQRENIVTELRTYLDQIDWGKDDWRNVEKITQAAKKEWRRFSPVERNRGKGVQTDFNQLIKSAEEHFKAHKEQARDAKEALIAQANSLLDSSNTQQAIRQIKQLQKEWKHIGPTFHSQEKKLWLTFREPCDALFARQEAEYAHKESTKEAGHALKKLIHTLQAQAEGPGNSAHVQALIQEGEALIKQQDTPPEPAVIDRFRSLCQTLNRQFDTLARFTQHPQQQTFVAESILLDEAEATWLSQHTLTLPTITAPELAARYQSLQSLSDNPQVLASIQAETEQQLRVLCIQMEILLGQDSPQSDQPQRMELQMQRLQNRQLPDNELPLIRLKKLEQAARALPFYRHSSLYSRWQALVEQI